MKPVRIIFLMLWVIGIGENLRAETLAPTERLVRVFSREVQQAEQQLEKLAGELEHLPTLQNISQGERYGFHSGTILKQSEPHWVQLDLGQNYPIDSLAMVPIHVPIRGPQGEGYGFPLRFKLEVADNAEMNGAVVLVDQTANDVENPGLYPLVFRPEVVTARYVRLTSTKHVATEAGFFWAMGELMVLCGNRNVAAECVVTATSHLELFPNWAVNRIVDSQSALGAPVAMEPSPTDGYLSVSSEQPQADKWLVVDLGRDFAIDEIRLIGVESEDYEVVGGRGFPKTLMVEIATDPEFKNNVWQMRYSPSILGHPWGSPVVMPCEGSSGRYVRLVGKVLWGREKLYSFALAEVQVYAGNENVALGKKVSVLDAAEKPGSTRWAPKFVVDGYTSSHRLIELPDYLELMVRRGKAFREQMMLKAQRDQKVQQMVTTMSVGGGSVGGVALFGWAWMLVRHRALRRREALLLREQIARDLHDDIGSNLGGIVLLSEMGSRHSGLGEEARNDFKAIKDAAEETSESMQDIVWLIEPSNMSLRELVLKMRQSVVRMLGDLPVSVVVDPPGFRNPQLSLLFRRHLFLSFKETLNNVRRHAAATQVEVHIAISSSHLAFTVRDNGAGFDPQAVAGSGHGLSNLQRRAQRLKGDYRLESAPGHGTTSYFKAPLKS